MTTFVEQIKHPHITQDEHIAGGKPIIAGSRIKVAQIVLEYERLGWAPDQIAEAHPHLSLAQIHDAISYYYDHQEEIDAQIASDDLQIASIKERIASLPGHIDANQDLR